MAGKMIFEKAIDNSALSKGKKALGRRIMQLFILSILVMSLFLAAPALSDSSSGIGATSGTCGESLTWAIEDGVLTVSGTGAMENYSSSNGPGWEAKKSTITSIIIGPGVTGIGAYAFTNCENLTSVSMSNTVITVEQYAFQECTALTNVVFSNSLIEIKNYAFSYCRALPSVELPSTLRTIGSNAFAWTGLQSLDIPYGVTSLGYDICYLCRSMQTLHIPGSIETIPGGAFEYCTGLITVTIDEGVKRIEGRAFCGNGITMGLKTIYIPSTVTTIGAVAFMNCDNLTDVYYAGDRAMADSISIGNNNACFTDAIWHFAIGSISPDDPDIKVFMLPSHLQCIEEEAFSNTLIEKVIVPANVTNIQRNAFYGCDHLMYLEFLDGDIHLTEEVLAGCDQVTIICPRNSPLSEWAMEHGYSVLQR